MGGISSVIVPKSQIVFGEPGNETTAFIQLVVNIFICYSDLCFKWSITIGCAERMLFIRSISILL